MKRRLVLMRHAKSSWDTEAPDHERPLNARGKKAAPRVGARLLELSFRPELVLSSDAQRTKETYDLLYDVMKDPLPVRYDASLYLAGVDPVRVAVRKIPDAVGTALLLGHNPGLEETLAWLTGADEALKTASAALLEADGASWAALVETPKRFKLLTIIRAKELS